MKNKEEDVKNNKEKHKNKVVEIKCNYDELLNIHEVKRNPKNTNIHTEEQVDTLSKAMEANGVRQNLVISKRSGLLIKGHLRLSAMERLGFRVVPVEYQDYKSEAEEYQDLNADNLIAQKSKTDLMMIKNEMELGEIENINIDGMGFSGLDLEIIDGLKEEEEDSEIKEDDLTKDLNTECPKCGFEFEK